MVGVLVVWWVWNLVRWVSCDCFSFLVEWVSLMCFGIGLFLGLWKVFMLMMGYLLVCLSIL